MKMSKQALHKLIKEQLQEMTAAIDLRGGDNKTIHMKEGSYGYVRGQQKRTKVMEMLDDIVSLGLSHEDILETILRTISVQDAINLLQYVIDYHGLTPGEKINEIEDEAQPLPSPRDREFEIPDDLLFSYQKRLEEEDDF
jgi:hypothetical protein